MSFAVKHKRRIYVSATQAHTSVFNSLDRHFRRYTVPTGPFKGTWVVFEVMGRPSEECTWRPLLENGWIGSPDHQEQVAKLFNPSIYTPEHINGSRRSYVELPLGFMVGKFEGNDRVTVLAMMNCMNPCNVTRDNCVELNCASLPVAFGVLSMGHTVPKAMSIASRINDRVVGDWYEIDIDELFGIIDRVDEDGYFDRNDPVVNKVFHRFSIGKLPVSETYPNSI